MSKKSVKGLPALWKIVLGTLAVALGVALYIWFKPSPCSFGDYKRAENITIGAQLEGKQLLRTTVGLSDAQSRDFDSRLQTYAAFYESSCRDQRRGMITKDEYNCRERNLRGALLGMESLETQLEAIAKLTDPAAQKAAAQEVLAKFQSLPQVTALAGCGPILSVNPQQLNFKGTDTDHFVTVSNIGFESLNFSARGMPSGFVPLPTSGALTPGGQTNVVVTRTNETVDPSQSFKFEIIDSGGEQVTVTITVAPENARVYSTLAERATQAALEQHKPLPTVSDVDTIWAPSNYSPATPPSVSSAVKELVFAQVLAKAGNEEAAKVSYSKAVAMAPALHQYDFNSVVIKKGLAKPSKVH
jgi:hypothetical protein